MKKRELKILGLSYSQSQLGSYVLVLSDTKSNKKLPLIIKPAEAQRIALELEDIRSPRPMIYDLFKSMSESYDIDIQEVFIYSLLEGIFYTRVITSNGLDTFEIESTVGDAIALAAIFQCPIYTTTDIMSLAGVCVDEHGEPVDDEELEKDTKSLLSIEDLENIMNEAIENEEYEIAAEIRDKIEEINKNKK
jgi:bifunctional DNase/RNase